MPKLYAIVSEEGENENKELSIKIIAGEDHETLAEIEVTQTHGNVAIYSAFCGDEVIAQTIDTKCPCVNCRGRVRL
jgi:hypothetical protein